MIVQDLINALHEADSNIDGEPRVYLSYPSSLAGTKEIAEVVAVVRQDSTGHILIVIGKEAQPLGDLR